MLRATALIIALLISFPAQAIPCWVVRQAVSDYGEAAAESWARGKHYTEQQIAEMRKCLLRKT